MRSTCFLVTRIGAAALLALAGTLVPSPARAASVGWCCLDGKVVSATESACKSKKGNFSLSRAKAEALCAGKEQGWCVAVGKVFASSREDCKKTAGRLFLTKAAAEKAWMAEKGWCVTADWLRETNRASCSKQKGEFFADRKAAVRAWESSKGWCVAGGKLRESDRRECLRGKGGFFASRAAAERVLPSAGPAEPRSPALLKREGSPLLPPVATQPLLLKQAVPLTAQKPGARAGLRRSGPLPEPAGEMRAQAPAARRQVARSSLPIEFRAPRTGATFHREETIRVRYVINMPTEAGDVTMRLLSTTRGELATTTHRYEPVDLSGVDFTDAEIEPAGGSGPWTIPEEGAEEDERPQTTGEQVLDWDLSSIPGLPTANDVYIQARKEGLLGRSPSFRIIPPVSLSDGVGVSVDVLSAGLFPGATMDLAYNCYGCACEGGPHLSFYGIFLHRVGEWESMALWRGLGVARSDGERTETFTIPATVTPASDYVVTIWAGQDCWGQSSAFPVNIMPTTPDFRVIRPAGGEAWQKGTTQTIRWSVAGLAGVDVGSPESVFTAHLLRGRDGEILEEIPVEGISCNLVEKTCALPWYVSPTLEENGYYKVRISVIDARAAGGARTCESRDYFRICDDCLVSEDAGSADVWIDQALLSSDNVPPGGSVPFAYHTDDRGTTVQLQVNLGWNERDFLEGCGVVVRFYRSDRGYSSYAEGSDAEEIDRITEHSAAHVGHRLPAGLAPGTTIPMRVELIVGHRDIAPRLRSPLELCERITRNNTFDFSLVLTDAGAR